MTGCVGASIGMKWRNSSAGGSAAAPSSVLGLVGKKPRESSGLEGCKASEITAMPVTLEKDPDKNGPMYYPHRAVL